MKRTVLIFTVDMIPAPGCHVSGGGLRAWSLGEGLKTKGHEVVYSVPQKLVERYNISDELNEYAFQPENLRKVIRKVVPDAILFEQWGLATYLEETKLPVAIDLYGSLVLENHFRRHRNFHSNVAAKIKTFAKADYIVCPSERQKNYFLPWLMLSGFDIGNKRIEVVPVSFSPQMPKKRNSKDFTFIFGGGLWPWINPFPALNIVSDEIKRNNKGHLKIFSQKPDIKKILPKDETLKESIFDIQHNDNVKFVGFISHDKLIKEYAGADVAVDIYQWNRERELAFSTRTIEYLWCGLPVIHAEYSEISDYIRKYKAGWCLDPDDAESIQHTVSEILSNKEKVKRFGRNAKKLVKDHFTWDLTIEPLHRFVTTPFPKTKKQTYFDLVSLEFDRIEDELEVENARIKEALVEKNKEIEQLLVTSKDELEGRDKSIWRLNQEIKKFQAQLLEELKYHEYEKDKIYKEKEEERKKFKAQLQNVRRVLKEENEARDKEIFRLNSELQISLTKQNQLNQEAVQFQQQLDSLKAKLHSSGNLIEQLTNERKKLQKLENQLREVINDQEAQIESYRGAVTDRDTEVNRLREIECQLREALKQKEGELDHSHGVLSERNEEIKGLTNRIHIEKEKVKHLQGVLTSIQNRFLYKLYIILKYRLKRLFIQYPRLFYLFIVNFTTNAYMSRWNKKHNTRIFPGQ